MAMKETSGGDSPLRQGAKKSFWTLPIFGSTAAADRDVFWKTDRVLGFSHRGVFIGEGAMSEVEPGSLTHGCNNSEIVIHFLLNKVPIFGPR
jgi:hypothetical protein